MLTANLPRPAAMVKAMRNKGQEKSSSTPSALYQKTQMCKFHRTGRCTRGAGCFFAHSKEELKELPDLTCTRICPTVQAGRECLNATCSYAHRRQELRAPVIPSQSKTSTGSRTPMKLGVAEPLGLPDPWDAATGLNGTGAKEVQPMPLPPITPSMSLCAQQHAPLVAPQRLFAFVPAPPVPMTSVAATYPVQQVASHAMVVPQPVFDPAIDDALLQGKHFVSNAKTSFSRMTTKESQFDDNDRLSISSFSWDGTMDNSEQDLLGFDPAESGHEDPPVPRTPSWTSLTTLDHEDTAERLWDLGASGDKSTRTSSWVCALGSSRALSIATKSSPSGGAMRAAGETSKSDSGEAAHEVDVTIKNTFVELTVAPSEIEGVRRSRSGPL